ncbi:LLM class F420-dependent oxidoreductase [Rhodopila sp.]|jgi:probable F420-dependent oxidoreductase|uniref:LLM class F420-dependent oxidoreductase n=1 Tax=Rhodopila sp. TaxID=2480087 RepID=UPI002BF11250|nr:LLM class F420-dependent oxidoreductase [Rhodopila sp.]HVZ08407.1 LLM class F420-dependent oxidoreductase [Rhodopila sp.]
MKFGLRYCNTGRFVDAARAVDLVQAAEEAGFESAWTVEHTVIPAGYQSQYPYSPSGKLPGGDGNFDLPDPLIWMAYVAARTTRIKLATGVIILPQHNPVITAKQVATLDAMSGGRVLLGVGVGWLKEEFDAVGSPFEERGARTDEYIRVMRELWTADRPSFNGKFFRFKDAFMRPKPANGSVPIIIGGHSTFAAKRAGRLGDGFFPARGASAELIQLVRDTAKAHGRDPAAVEITTSLPKDLDELPRLEAAGVDRVLVPVSFTPEFDTVVRGPEDCARWRDVIARHA